jgi:hypothetical protein
MKSNVLNLVVLGSIVSVVASCAKTAGNSSAAGTPVPPDRSTSTVSPGPTGGSFSITNIYGNGGSSGQIQFGPQIQLPPMTAVEARAVCPTLGNDTAAIRRYRRSLEEEMVKTLREGCWSEWTPAQQQRLLDDDFPLYTCFKDGDRGEYRHAGSVMVSGGLHAEFSLTRTNGSSSTVSSSETSGPTERIDINNVGQGSGGSGGAANSFNNAQSGAESAFSGSATASANVSAEAIARAAASNTQAQQFASRHNFRFDENTVRKLSTGETVSTCWSRIETLCRAVIDDQDNCTGNSRCYNYQQLDTLRGECSIPNGVYCRELLTSTNPNIVAYRNAHRNVYNGKLSIEDEYQKAIQYSQEIMQTASSSSNSSSDTAAGVSGGVSSGVDGAGGSGAGAATEGGAVAGGGGGGGATAGSNVVIDRNGSQSTQVRSSEVSELRSSTLTIGLQAGIVWMPARTDNWTRQNLIRWDGTPEYERQKKNLEEDMLEIIQGAACGFARRAGLDR